MMASPLRSAFAAILSMEGEARKLAEFALRACPSGTGRKAVDVGCGFGRNLIALRAKGLDMLGVEVNAQIVQRNLDAGLPCVSAEDFAQTNDAFDLLLMSHVIEHFAPEDLFRFLDGYLDRLGPDGYLLIATPLSSNNFYDDFDHVKPYQPLGLLMVFGEQEAQVQYYARNRLRLVDLWYRRSYWRINHARGRLVRSRMGRVLQIVDLLSALAFRCSGGLLGRTDGWVGLFRKVGAATPVGTGSR